MTLSKGAIGNLINRYRAVLKKCRLMNAVGSLAVAGLLVAGGAGSSVAYEYFGEAGKEAASSSAWREGAVEMDRPPIVKTEGTPTTYTFRSGIYNGENVPNAWLIGADKDIRIVSDGPLTIEEWGGDSLTRGAITARGGTIIFGDSVSILNNCSSGEFTNGGGAIYSDKGITFGKDAVLEGNTVPSVQGGAYKGGGAIFLNAPEGRLVFGDSARITGNSAYQGGAILALGSVTFGEGASITNNSVTQSGGALCVTGTLTLNSGSTVQGNKAVASSNGGIPNGGAVYIKGNAAITGTTFQQNGAPEGTGGAISIESGTLNLAGGSSMKINNAEKGGAVFAKNKASVALNDTSFVENEATGEGGALYLDTSSLTVQTAGGENGQGTHFQNNSALNAGGAIFALKTPVTLGEGTTLEGNSSARGGALFVEGDGTTQVGVSKALFENNTASSDGGAVSALKSALTITDTAFINNTAVQKGGAISLQEGSLLFKVTGTSPAPLISGNTAGVSGGFLHLTQSTATFEVAEGAQLHIGDPLSTGDAAHRDSLGLDASSSLEKTGAGELRVNSALGDLLGTVDVKAGTMSVARHWEIRNTVSVTGGTLDLPSFSFSGADAKLRISGGTLVTETGQIFETPLNAAGDNEDAGGVKADVGAHMDFISGRITFDDANYNLQYAGSAAAALGASYGQQSGKEITFTGVLYTPQPEPMPEPAGTVTVGELNAQNVTNVVLGNVTIATDPAAGKNLIVGATAVDDPRFSNAEALSGSIGSRNIDLGANGSGVAVVGGHYLTLVGSNAHTPLVSAGSGGEKPVDVLVGGLVNGQPSKGTLNLGTQAMPSGGILNGTVRLAASSALNVRAGKFTLTGQPSTAGVDNGGGTLNVAEGAALNASIRQTSGETNVAGRLESSSVELEDGRLNVSGTADIKRLVQHGGKAEVSGTLQSASVEADGGLLRVIGQLRADSLDAASGLRVEVGDGNAAGKLHVASASLGGAGLFLDPAWRGGDMLKDASHAILNFRNQEVDGKLTVGRNGLLVLGDASADWTLGVFDASGLRWGPEGATAALSVRTPQRLDPAKGALAVDGSLTTAPTLAPNTVFFGDRSLFVVDASGLKGGAALTARGGTLTVADTAALLLGNVTEGEYVITAGFTDNAGVRGWEGDFLTTPDQLIALTLDKSEAGTIKVRASALDAGDVLPGLALRNIVNEIWGSGRNNVHSPNMGIRFLSRAVNENYLSRGEAAGVIDGAAQIAVAGGVQGTALATASAPVRAVQNHASLSRAVARRGGDVQGEGINLWIDALYGANRVRGFEAGSLDGGYNADFGGVVLGGDVGAGPFRVGVALDIGGGMARSRGDFASTKNNFDFWGVTLYGAWTRDCLNLMADAGYSGGSHEVRQDLPASLRLGRLEADVNTRVMTAGLRGEYLIPTAWVDVMPHVGARYAALTTDAFTSQIEGRDVFRISRDTQHVWTFPAGVTFGKDVQTESGWKVKSRADFSVVPAAGDVKARTRARVFDVAASDTVRSRIVDTVTFDGSVGLELKKDNISLSLNYGMQASEHQTGQNIAVSFTYEF